jgi:hypothetical protein
MFICPSTEQCCLSFEHVPPFDDVREDHGIQVADMRGSIDIEYWCGDVVGLLGGLGGNLSSTATATIMARRANPW